MKSEPAVAADLGAGDWVAIPGGPFIMGSDEVRPDGRPLAASPRHTVDVDSFRIARSPVSVAEFARFVDETSYVTTAERSGRSWVWIGTEDKDMIPDQEHLWINLDGATWRAPRGPGSDIADKADHPVTNVSHRDAIAYCEWSGTRLPTEAEWEKAARGTDGRNYAWGDTPPTATVCNHSMNVRDTTPIGAYPDAAGPYGVHDVAGNVWEIMGTGWHRYPFDKDKSPQTIVTKFGTVELGTIRGGSFYNNFDPRGVAVWVRTYILLDYSCYDMGFRVCAC
ncbi:SUMF1/EgtB/PvdO family nonheme iron enzyme [Alloactinosynnema sp. L-07]|uniref:formylglycine-generating enzyme family protein n=1 Tax=Alloactinosynnema sp. L-07 TaxID=1653480 RepID=UPI001E5CE25A|nr:SUMF1/EgtB/PvdO family nonheme iron enzyme [Alloactinosynnema sp. L-07]